MSESEDLLDQIRLAAARFREAIIRSNGGGRHSLADFPRGACGDASILLGQYFFEHGFGEWEYVSGRGHDRDRTDHAWIEQGDLLVDITLSQFGAEHDPVTIRRDKDWHHQTYPEEDRLEARLDEYDYAAEGRLGAAYDTIVSMIRN